MFDKDPSPEQINWENVDIRREDFDDKTALLFPSHMALLGFFADKIKPNLTTEQFRDIQRGIETRSYGKKEWHLMVFNAEDYKNVIEPILQSPEGLNLKKKEKEVPDKLRILFEKFFALEGKPVDVKILTALADDVQIFADEKTAVQNLLAREHADDPLEKVGQMTVQLHGWIQNVIYNITGLAEAIEKMKVAYSNFTREAEGLKKDKLGKSEV